jgi:hypothetical protein
MHSRTLCALASLLAGVACSDGASPIEQAACTGDVTLSVTSGTAPSISWSPACKLFLVLVEAEGGDVWAVISDGANAIATPVRYGVVPTGATELQAPTPLVAGLSYSVSVFRWTGPNPQDGTPIGQKIFTP